MNASKTSLEALTDEQQTQLDQIRDEIERMVARRDTGTALSSLNSIRENVPDTEEYTMLHAALLALRADVLLDVGDMERAWEDAEEAMEIGWTEAGVFDVAGWAHFGRDRPETAREYFDEALERESDRVSSLLGRALSLQEIDEFDMARSDLTHALNVEPDNAELYAVRSEISLRQQKFDQAERDIEQAIELEPDDPEYRLAHARMLMVRGNVDEASTAVRPAADREDASLEALLIRSHLHLLQGNSSSARADAIRASNRFPDEAFAFVQLAHVQLAEGKLNLAKKAAERAVELDASLPDSYMVRGAALHMSGESERAAEDFERAKSAPAELPMLLLGNSYDLIGESGLEMSINDMLNQYQASADASQGAGQAGASPFSGLGGMAGMGGLDPMKLMGQLFDDSGEMKGQYKPFLEMAMKNAPNILKNVPPSLLQNVGGLDPSQLEDLELGDLSSDQIEDQMRKLYEMMQSGEGPFAGQNSDDSDDDDSED
ncbi:MAG: tetratricopeptide repeat protein [Myxococcota bacterium]